MNCTTRLCNLSFHLPPIESFLKNTNLSIIDVDRAVLLDVVNIAKCQLAIQLFDVALYGKVPWSGTIKCKSIVSHMYFQCSVPLLDADRKSLANKVPSPY